jgi:hypothetical protein
MTAGAGASGGSIYAQKIGGKAMRGWMALVAVMAGAPVLAGDFPAGQSYIVELEGTVADSGLGEYYVPPLVDAFDAAGLRYEGGPGAVWVATVENIYDTGSWVTRGGKQEWLYERRVLVGLSPADFQPAGGNVSEDPAFGVEAVLMTPDADRVDELDCLIAAAVRVLADSYRATGRVSADAQVCERK